MTSIRIFSKGLSYESECTVDFQKNEGLPFLEMIDPIVIGEFPQVFDHALLIGELHNVYNRTRPAPSNQIHACYMKQRTNILSIE